MFWLPIIGPIIRSLIEGGVSAYNKSQDVSLKKQQSTDQTDLDVIKARAQVSIAEENIGNCIMRDMFMFFTAIWYSAIVWDKIFDKNYNFLVIGVSELPTSISYIPYAVIAYLFVTAWRGPK